MKKKLKGARPAWLKPVGVRKEKAPAGIHSTDPRSVPRDEESLEGSVPSPQGFRLADMEEFLGRIRRKGW